MTIIIQTRAGESGFRVHAGDGQGWLWTADPERAIEEARERLRRFVAAELAVRRDGAARHVRVIAGVCPTCGLPASDCVGDDL